MQLLGRVCNTVSAVWGGLTQLGRPRVWSTADLVAVMAGWPSLYQLLPALDLAAIAADPLRPAVYDGARWPADRGVSQLHLTNARDVWGPALAGVEALPPPAVLVCVAGVGVRTPHVLLHPDRLGTSRAWGWTDEGDGRVAADSALLPGYAGYRVRALHGDLQSCTEVLDRVAGWATAVLPSPLPADPPAAGVLVVGRPGPPGGPIPWTNVIGDC